jgi:hypothetical protein
LRCKAGIVSLFVVIKKSVGLIIERIKMKIKQFFILSFLYLSIGVNAFDTRLLPEIYQDVLIHGKTIHQGIRNCSDRYEAIKGVLADLPQSFKSLDIGASQGYFSFRMAHDFNARCTMIEGGYTNTNKVWPTGEYLRYLCAQNSHLKNLTLFQQLFSIQDFQKLGQLEHFDLVIAFSVIHHMRSHDAQTFTVYNDVIDAILNFAPVALIENPINTGEHTQYIRRELQKRGGKVIYQSPRGSLIYEIYLFDRRTEQQSESLCKDISKESYRIFNGSYSNAFNA